MLQRYSLRIQLLMMAMAVVALALLIAGGLLHLTDRRQSREAVAAEMLSLAQLVANRSAAAIAFTDEATARENLTALARLDQVGRACLYSTDNPDFVIGQQAADTCTPMGNASEVWQTIDGDVARVQVPVFSGESVIGAVQIESSAQPLAARARTRMISLALALAVGLAAALALALRLQRVITRPISRVRDVATAIIESHDYRLRAPDLGKHEVGSLADAFNAMLTEITELTAQLEARVQARTAELARTNGSLQEALDSLRLAQSELIQREKLASLGSLVAGIAHELNTPLGNSVTVASTLPPMISRLRQQIADGTLRKSTALDALQQLDAGADLLERNLERASHLISRFKQVAVDQTSEQRRSFDLADIVGKVVDTLRHQFKYGAHSVEIDIEPGLALDSYPGPLGQVITNLVMNALIHAFGPELGRAGQILIRNRPTSEGHVLLEVRDNGSGIAAAHLARIFDPFFTTRMGQGGSGLGLNIVYNIVVSTLGGSIKVASTVGEGTSFTIRLPIHAPEPADEATPDRIRTAGGASQASGS